MSEQEMDRDRREGIPADAFMGMDQAVAAYVASAAPESVVEAKAPVEPIEHAKASMASSAASAPILVADAGFLPEGAMPSSNAMAAHALAQRAEPENKAPALAGTSSEPFFSAPDAHPAFQGGSSGSRPATQPEPHAGPMAPAAPRAGEATDSAPVGIPSAPSVEPALPAPAPAYHPTLPPAPVQPAPAPSLEPEPLPVDPQSLGSLSVQALALSGNEGQSASGLLSAIDSYGDALSYAVVAGHGPSHGSVSIDAAGVVSYAASSASWNGTDDFQVRVSDQHGLSAVAAVHAVIAPTAEAPSISSAGAHGTEDGGAVSLPLNVSSADSISSVVISGLPVGATLSAGTLSGGAWHLVPADLAGLSILLPVHWAGSATLDVVATAQDGSATATSTAQVSLVVDHEAPTATSDPVSVIAGHSASGAVVGSEADGAALSYSLVSGHGPSHGSVVLAADGTFVFAADAGYAGSDSFQVLVSNGFGQSVARTVSVTAAADSISLSSSGGTGHGTVSGSVSGTNASGDAMAYAVVTQASSGTVSVDASSGAWTYAPTGSWAGGDADSAVISVSDGHGLTVQRTISILETNDAPVLSSAGTSTVRGGTANGTISATDGDGDSLSITASASHGTVVVNGDGTWTYTETDTSFTGTDTVSFAASDHHGGTASSTASVVVGDGASFSVSLTGGSGHGDITGTVQASDQFSDAMAYSIVSQGSSGTVSIDAATGAYAYSPSGAWVGGQTDSFVVRASDGHGGTHDTTITVDETDAAPAVSGAASLSGTTHAVPVAITQAQLLGPASDADGDALSISGLSADHGSLFSTGPGAWSLDPQGFDGTITLSYSVLDGHGGSTAATATLVSSDTAPTASTTGGSGLEGHVITGAVVGSDTDGDSLSYALVAGHGPAHGSVSLAADGSYSYSSTGYAGTDSFRVLVSDGHGGSVAEDVSVSVGAVTISTSASGGSGPAEAAIGGSLSASVSSGDAVSWSLSAAHSTSGGVETAALAHGSISLDEATGAYTFTPDAGFVGTDSFTAIASDAYGNSASRTVTVTAQDNAPTVSGSVDLGSVGHNATLSISSASLLGNASDIDGQTLSILGTPTADHGTISASGGGWTYSSGGYVGPVALSYTVSDGAGGTVADTATITTTDAAPTASGFSISATSGTPHTGDLTADSGAADADGDSLAWSLASGPSHGSVSVAADGSYSYSGTNGYAGADSFTATASDGHGGSVSVRRARRIPISEPCRIPWTTAQAGSSPSIPRRAGSRWRTGTAPMPSICPATMWSCGRRRDWGVRRRRASTSPRSIRSSSRIRGARTIRIPASRSPMASGPRTRPASIRWTGCAWRAAPAPDGSKPPPRLR
ncbi:protein of unknown function (Cadherin-like domain 959-1046) (plasmid) [Magnetospirillum sp. XM-1]|uniref:Ig-like domain-containing protein n=1 Tax=Magnetospirillum sp. XM-1 TaxID=1663591 RepID=UPI00073E0E88|nr:Ig-like domain-containing protein [Magnetospirillum sp. XM-1]CUW41973.1 protein of unknown function (Cadherin-like domain 959-1046) [Magnetospirillum sp. XM-1]